MANFVTADDKRIYNLQEIIGDILSSSIPLDKSGNIEAKRITVQNLVNAINANISFILAKANTNTPDNALGNNGDLYYQIPADGSFIRMFQKINGAYTTIFNLPISSASEPIIKNGGDVNSDYELDLTADNPPQKNYIVFINDQQAQSMLNYDFANKKITGFQDGLTAGDEIKIYFS